MATAFVSGTAGRLRVGGSAVGGVKAWKLNKQLTMVPTPHFELTVDAQGVMWNQVTLKGLAGATVDVEAHFDIGDNIESTLKIGASVTLDLILNKASSFGYLNLGGTVMDVGPGTNVENQAAAFPCKIQLTGTIAAAA